MSRSKHTDPSWLRASRRTHAPRDGRGVADISRRRLLGAARKAEGVPAGASDGRTVQKRKPTLRIITQRPRPGFFHPATKRDIVNALKNVEPTAFYGLRRVELCRSQTNGSIAVFGRYCAPDRIVLFEQAQLPWRW